MLPASTPTPTAPTPQARVPHLPFADVVRVLTFACVIAVHTISTTLPLDDRDADGVVMLLHFTREAFFVLTAFVLVHVHVHARRPVRPAPFWRRRFLLVGVPYVVWTVLYTGLQQVPAPLPPAVLAWSLGLNLATGVGWYHLYFLLVSLQFYLVFPAVQRLLRATQGRHRWVLLAALVLQVLVDLWSHDPAPTGWKADVLPYAGSFVGSYVFFLALGAVAAVHREAVLGVLQRHPFGIVAAVLGTGAAAETWYQTAVTEGADPMFAVDVFQPVMIPWVVAVVAAFTRLGMGWTRRDRPPRWITAASERSFGVFLVHPMFLWAMAGGWFVLTGRPALYADLPAPLPTVAAYLTAVAASLATVELLRRTRLRLPLTGKPYGRKTE